MIVVVVEVLSRHAASLIHLNFLGRIEEIILFVLVVDHHQEPDPGSWRMSSRFPPLYFD